MPFAITMAGFPRTRGDGPRDGRGERHLPPVPPHPRGWSHLLAGVPVIEQGSPAPAGMVPTECRPCPARQRFPRTRGDGPIVDPGGPLTIAVPPHPRGWSRRTNVIADEPRGSPAPAGMVPSDTARHWRYGRFPRTRGDGPQTSATGAPPVAVPPHPRGWSISSSLLEAALTGSPAPAGMVPRST